jgi:hypothetical protein
MANHEDGEADGMSCGTDTADLFRRAASYADRIIFTRHRTVRGRRRGVAFGAAEGISCGTEAGRSPFSNGRES